jgi:hypothetical protein
MIEEDNHNRNCNQKFFCTGNRNRNQNWEEKIVIGQLQLD